MCALGKGFKKTIIEVSKYAKNKFCTIWWIIKQVLGSHHKKTYEIIDIIQTSNFQCQYVQTTAGGGGGITFFEMEN